MAINKIYFCFPYREVGGVSMLFLRVAEALAQQKDYECHVIDYSDGYIAKRMNKELVNLAEYNDDIYLDIPSDALIVFQSMTPWSIFPQIRPSLGTKVLFWNCHPLNLIPTLPGLRSISLTNNLIAKRISELILFRYIQRSRKFVTHLLKHHGLVFMDHENVSNTEQRLMLSIQNPRYLQIPATSEELRELPSRKNFKKTPVISLCWVGRIVDFKFFILKRLLDDLEEIADNLDFGVRITIVGNGDYLQKLRNYSVKFEKYTLNFIGHLETEVLNEFLVKEIDILFAMGTSALEGAKFGIPTILLDIAYSEVSEKYEYRWLFQRDGSTLGETLKAFNKSGSSVNSLKFIFKDFFNKEDYFAHETLKYFHKNHALEVVVDKLVHRIKESECLWGELQSKRFLNRGLIYPIFKFLRGVVQK